MYKPLLIAHRGDTSHYPENTIEAFQSAFSLGADGIEFDVQLSKNGEIIVVHDYLYDNEKKYPLFSDVLEKFSSKGKLEIEIKSLDSSIVEKVAEIVNKFNPPNFELTSSILPLLPIIRKSFPDAKIGMIFNSKLFEGWMTPEFIVKLLLGYMKLTSANVLHLDLDRYTSQIAEEFHKNNYVLHTHLKTADLSEHEKAQRFGIDQCSFDDINLIKNLVPSPSV